MMKNDDNYLKSGFILMNGRKSALSPAPMQTFWIKQLKNWYISQISSICKINITLQGLKLCGILTRPICRNSIQMALLGSASPTHTKKQTFDCWLFSAMNNAGLFCNIRPKLNMYQCTFPLQNQFGYINGLPGVLSSEVAGIQ